MPVLVELDSCYADLALWVPFWNRMVKALKFQGKVINEHGEIILVEILGPPNIDAWISCYKLFRTSSRMYRLIDEGKLDRYQTKIHTLARKNPHCWALIYQADVGARLEQAPKIKARLIKMHDKALKAGQESTFDPARPWNSVWGVLTDGIEGWWFKHVTEPAIYIYIYQY